MSEILDIKRKIKQYYQDLPTAKELILTPGSEFYSNLQKALALACLDPKLHEEDLKRLLLDNQEWKALQQDYEELDEVLSVVDLKNFLDPEYITVNFYLNEFKDDFTLDQWSELFNQVNHRHAQRFVDYMGHDKFLVFMFLKGVPEFLLEDINTAPDAQRKYESIEVEFLGFKKEAPGLASLLLDNNLNEEFLYAIKENLTVEEYVGKIDFKTYGARFLGMWEYALVNNHSNLKSILQVAEASGLNKEINQKVQDVFQLKVKEDEEVGVKNLMNLGISSETVLEESLNNISLKTFRMLFDDFNLSVETSLPTILDFSEKIGDAEVFALFFENLLQTKVKANLSVQSTALQKICLKSNNSRNPFYQAVWEYLQKTLMLKDLVKGKHSFAYWYPEFYQDLLDCESYNLFYDLESFQQFVQNNYSMKKEKVVLINLISQLSIKFSTILKVLTKDLSAKKHQVKDQPFTDEDLAVLGAYKERLVKTVGSINAVLELVTQKVVNFDKVFDTRNHANSIPNLKGFYLGELKIGGLENFTGHSKTLQEILAPLGFLLNPDIKKEVDHYIAVKDNQLIKLNLVETKNFQRILTRTNPRISKIQDQKQYFDENLNKVKVLNKDLKFEARSTIYLTRGLTEKAYQVLSEGNGTATPYDEVQGVRFNFQNMDQVTFDTFNDLCEKIKRRKDKNSDPIDWDIFRPEFREVARSLVMVEEDSEDKLSADKYMSPNLQNNLIKFRQIAKKHFANEGFFMEVAAQICLQIKSQIEQREGV